MKKVALLVVGLFACSYLTHAQNLEIPIDTAVVTNHTTTINGQKISYKATTGMQPVWDAEGNPMATLYYTYYKRNTSQNIGERPLLISFNGGPGSASVWMHVAYTGPQILNIDDEGHPVQPYGVSENPYSVLDIADIVYVNPVNTGYSRALKVNGKEVPKERFFGVNADIKYLAEWVNTFVTRNERWSSPKYLIGESYGGTRVSGLALELQESQWMYLNGVILVSPADYKSRASDPAVSSVLNVPYFTAAAWHHKVLASELQNRELEAVLPESEDFAINTLMPALAKGGALSLTEKQQISKRMSYLTGLSEKSILQYNLDIPSSFFWKELLRDESGYTIGRLDSRYMGLDKIEGGDSPEYNSAITSWLHSFTPAINFYIREHLKFKTDVKYNVFGSVRPWSFENNTTRDDLRKAMATNPYLNVMFQVGYYDGATTYFNSKYTMWQMDPSGKLSDRFSFKGYRSGHMMYLRREDLKTSNDDIREFIKASASNGESAKY